MECRRRWEDVGVIFGAGLLEAMQRGVAVVLCEALVLMAFSGQLHGGVFGKRHTHVPAMKTLAIQVAHGWGGFTRKIMFNTAKMGQSFEQSDITKYCLNTQFMVKCQKKKEKHEDKERWFLAERV